MGVLISIRRQKAILRRGEWMCANAEIEDLLKQATADWFRAAVPGTGAPQDEETALAAEMARRFGGRVLLKIPSNSRVNGKIYFAKRQLKFDFGSGDL
ncbi:MAG: hypothetical protein ABI693_30625 [Bryobacteraceae bacterium]